MVYLLYASKDEDEDGFSANSTYSVFLYTVPVPVYRICRIHCSVWYACFVLQMSTLFKLRLINYAAQAQALPTMHALGSILI